MHSHRAAIIQLLAGQVAFLRVIVRSHLAHKQLLVRRCHLSCAASGASDAPRSMPIAWWYQANSWREWRGRFPSRRAQANPPVFALANRLSRNQQRPWHVYGPSSNPHVTQQWAMVPRLVQTEQNTQPLAGAPAEAMVPRRGSVYDDGSRTLQQ